MVNTNYKKCIKCGNVKHLTEYYYYKSTERYDNRCKDCCKKLSKENRERKKLRNKDAPNICDLEVKRCTLCNKVLPIDMFYKNGKNNLRAECKSCTLYSQRIKRWIKDYKKQKGFML